MDTGDEVETQVEAFAATAVTLAENAKDFELTDDLFDAQAKTSQRADRPGRCRLVQDAVGLFLLVGERVTLAGFGRQTGMGVQLVQARVAEVGEHDGVGMEVGSTFLEQSKIVRPSLTEGDGDNLAGIPVEQKLRL